MIKETYYLFGRALRKLARTPVMIFFSLFMPLLWIVLFSQLFRKLADLPNFPTHSYLDYFTAGVVTMTVLTSGFQSGMSVVLDMDSGFLDKLLVTPIHRLSILLGRLLTDGVRIIIQASIIITVALVMGAHIENGIPGFILMVLIAAFFGIAWAGISNIVAIATKNSELTMMIGMLLTFPILFMSTALMPLDFQPDWMEQVSKFNPASYVVDGIRSLMVTNYDWVLIGKAFLIIGVVALFSLTGAVLMLRRLSH
jgi:ABC-2 type transport system permease protein